jgi:broad specificity phosphatase PhoE
MDAVVKPVDRPSDRPAKAAPPGRIIVVRHGRPQVIPKEGPPMGWKDYKAWWAKYELSSLKEGQRCPEALLSQISDDAIIMSSARRRAIETAGQLGRGRDVKHDAMFNEAPLPAPKLGIFPMRPKNWNKIARLLWMLGHSGGEEHVSDAKRRAAKAAELLVQTAQESGGRDVVLAAHGWFNRMLRPQLKKRGWANVHDGGDKYWSFRIYQKR